jgi:hypothetical protein
MIDIADMINAAFETLGAPFIALSIIKLHREKQVRGISWVHASFFCGLELLEPLLLPPFRTVVEPRWRPGADCFTLRSWGRLMNQIPQMSKLSP